MFRRRNRAPADVVAAKWFLCVVAEVMSGGRLKAADLFAEGERRAVQPGD
jgi:hypothetical protein